MRTWLVLTCTVLALLLICQLTIIATSRPSQDLFTPLQRFPLDRRFPSALIIGVRKGGTRALLDALALHPSIREVRRETHFFDANYSRGFDWYRSMMPFASVDQVVIEKTPGYFTSKLAPKRISEFNPGMKLILIVRDPVQRMVSDFTQVFYNKKEQNKTLPIFEEEVFLKGTEELNGEYKPVRNSLYHMHLENWLNYFSMDQIHLVNGDVFRGNPLSELKRVEEFLGLPSLIRRDQLVFNEKKGFFCFVRSPGVASRCLGVSKGRPHRPVAVATHEKVRQHLRRHNSLFFQQVNRLFSW